MPKDLTPKRAMKVEIINDYFDDGVEIKIDGERFTWFGTSDSFGVTDKLAELLERIASSDEVYLLIEKRNV